MPLLIYMNNMVMMMILTRYGFKNLYSGRRTVGHDIFFMAIKRPQATVMLTALRNPRTMIKPFLRTERSRTFQ